MSMTQGMVVRALCALVLVAFTGCYKITYRVADGRGETYKEERWRQYFVGGVIPAPEKFRGATLCRSGTLMQARSYQGPVHVLASLFSFGMSSAAGLETTCSSKSESGS